MKLSLDQPQYEILNHKVRTLHKVIVHRFKVSDVEDPEVYAASPLLEWEQSEMGSWVMTHSVEPPTWQQFTNQLTFCTEYVILAVLADKDYTFWTLKWGQK